VAVAARETSTGIGHVCLSVHQIDGKRLDQYVGADNRDRDRERERERERKRVIEEGAGA
jgi:hypothetical protein